jgi:hypothetical protein
MLRDRAQVFLVPITYLYKRWVASRRFVHGSRFNLKNWFISWLSSSGSHMKAHASSLPLRMFVDNTSVVLVVEFLWWFTEPLLDMFGIWSFGCIALRDPYDR